MKSLVIIAHGIKLSALFSAGKLPQRSMDLNLEAMNGNKNYEGS